MGLFEMNSYIERFLRSQYCLQSCLLGVAPRFEPAGGGAADFGSAFRHTTEFGLRLEREMRADASTFALHDCASSVANCTFRLASATTRSQPTYYTALGDLAQGRAIPGRLLLR